MNKKFNVILFILVICSVLPVKAKHFTIGPEIGYERSNYHLAGKKVSDMISAQSGNGFRIGVSVTYDFENDLFIQSGLTYSQREGAKLLNIENPVYFPHIKNIDLNKTQFLTVPLSVGYEFRLLKKWGVALEAGGYIASGLGDGSSHFSCNGYEGSAGSIFQDSKFTINDPENSDRIPVTIDKSNRIDTGLLFGGHIRFNNIRLRASYQLGLVKTIYDIAIPRTFTLSVCYDFRL